jgi:hypothetical protein
MVPVMSARHALLIGLPTIHAQNTDTVGQVRRNSVLHRPVAQYTLSTPEEEREQRALREGPMILKLEKLGQGALAQVLRCSLLPFRCNRYSTSRSHLSLYNNF